MQRRTAAGTALAVAIALLPTTATVQAAAKTADGCSPISTPAHYTGSVPTPRQVLGYDLGTREASDADIGRYVQAVDRSSDRVVSGTFATSWEGRPLRYALVGSPQTLRRLSEVRSDLARLREPATSDAAAAAIIRRTPVVLWISANVHGDEPSGGDAVLRLLYQLADRDDCVSRAILGNALVGLIPTQNPDGRAHDVRTNAYAFDMNRDWFARTQPEVAGKLDLLWRYPPQLYVDEHEMGGTDYFFPPDSDPVYAETPNFAYREITHLYGSANAAAFQAKGWRYETYQSGYDLFYQGYGDTVPTTEFGAAGMTYEQGDATPYPLKTLHHFTSGLVSLYTGATHRAAILSGWRRIFVQAQNEGEDCRLERNTTFNPGHSVLRQVPSRPVCGYFLRGDGAETRLVVRRLQLARVQVDRLTAPLVVPDFTPYGGTAHRTTLPAGTYWVTMAQPQKHWVQAMLNEDTYVPFPYFYDVSGWSNPLLAGVAGGFTGRHVTASLRRVPLLAEPAPPTLPASLPRVGIIDQRPTPSYQYSTTGWLKWRLSQDWNVPYTVLTPGQVTAAALRRLDVLLVPDVDVTPTRRQLGAAGRAALRAWVHRGGRYVGWQGGADEAVQLGLSSVSLTRPAAKSPGALIRVEAPHPDTYVMWEDYDPQMTAGSARVVAAFPSHLFVSGYAEKAKTLAGTAVEAVDRVGTGSVTVFSVEPNYRGYTDASARLLLDAMLHTPSGSVSGAAGTTGAATQSPYTRTPAQHLDEERRGTP